VGGKVCAEPPCLIPASRRKDRSNEGKIASAKAASALHFKNQGRYFYLTEDVILNDHSPFDDLLEPEQLLDPNLILPDEVNLGLVLKQYVEGTYCPRAAGHAYEATVVGQAIPAFPGTLSSLSSFPPFTNPVAILTSNTIAIFRHNYISMRNRTKKIP
jgi:hypothetical protein